MTRRSRLSLAMRMLKNKKPHRFGEVVPAGADLAPVHKLRYSNVAATLPTPEARAEFQRDKVMAAHCPTHGAIEDPAVILTGEGADMRVAFICPWCSGPELLARWEREGAS